MDKVEAANSAQLGSILKELLNTTLFKHIRVKLDDDCPFWQKKEECNSFSEADIELKKLKPEVKIEPLCTLKNSESPKDFFSNKNIGF